MTLYNFRIWMDTELWHPHTKRPLDFSTSEIEVRSGVGPLKFWVEANQPLFSPMSSAAMLVSAPWRRVPWIPWALKKHMAGQMAIFERFFFQKKITEIGGSYTVVSCRFCLAVAVPESKLQVLNGRWPPPCWTIGPQIWLRMWSATARWSAAMARGSSGNWRWSLWRKRWRTCASGWPRNRWGWLKRFTVDFKSCNWDIWATIEGNVLGIWENQHIGRFHCGFYPWTVTRSFWPGPSVHLSEIRAANSQV